MALAQADRIAFSLQIVSADSQAAALDQAAAQLQSAIAQAQSLDAANKNLFDPTNALVTSYQTETQMLDGNGRTVIIEQDIQDAAAKKLQNHFFPNDTTITVPALSATHNVWTQSSPFALTFAIGETYTQTYTSVPKEGDLISAILADITSAMSNLDIENTTGQHCIQSGTCSIPMYTDQATCEANSGTWTSTGDSIVTFPAVQTLLTNIVASVHSLVTFLTTEVAAIVTTDTNPTNQANNNVAISNINTVILPALNAWLANPDFNTAHGQTTCAGFNGYNSNLLAPTKLHSTQLATLQSALNARTTFITTRLGQLTTLLGTIVQDVTNGSITSSSGLYGKRYNLLVLRLDSFNGSLSKLLGLQTSSNAQATIKASILANKATYYSIVPTSILNAAGNGTSTITLADTSFLSAGDTVYVTAVGQDELQRAVKSVAGNLIVLNDVIPAKYVPSSMARLYKDNS